MLSVSNGLSTRWQVVKLLLPGFRHATAAQACNWRTEQVAGRQFVGQTQFLLSLKGIACTADDIKLHLMIIDPR